MGKFNITVRKTSTQSSWKEDYDKDEVTSQEEAEAWGKAIVIRFNKEEDQDLERGRIDSVRYREFVSAEYLG